MYFDPYDFEIDANPHPVWKRLRDERKFVDADRFDIHRKIDHHLSIGYGIDFCLGAALARFEGLVALDEVLKRFPSWEVDWDSSSCISELDQTGRSPWRVMRCITRFHP